jgi:hypothetical protein
MRALRGHSVVPIVELASKPMLTEFGKKLRPDFTVIGWRDLGGVSAPQIEHEPDQIGEPVAPVSFSEELNDEIPEFGASQK